MKKSKKSKRYSETADIEYMSNKSFNWFPGHMKKALKKIQESLKKVDIIIEVRDARAPMATANSAFIKEVGNKNRLIVFNKVNLANPEITQNWIQWLTKNNVNYLFTNVMNKKSLSEVLEKSKQIVLENHLKSNPDAQRKRMLKMMIIGLPNTGKSTLINRFSNRDASKVADKPGQTQQQLWVKATDELQILDTPGVMPPHILSERQALCLSAIHAIPERISDYEDTAIFILKEQIKKNPKALESHYKIEKISEDFLEALGQIAKVRGCLAQKNEYDYDRVYKLIIQDFRAGNLGLISFEVPPQN